jgi:hypothetical protein
MASKKCRVCGEEKSLDDFYYRKDSGEYRNECKKCIIIKNNQHSSKNYEKNKEKIKKQSDGYYKNNKEVILKRHKVYQEKNKDKIKEYINSYIKNNKEKIRDNSKQHYVKNKEKILENNKLYYKNNKDKIRKRHKKYESQVEAIEKRRKRDIKKRANPVFRLCQSVSVGISQSLKLQNLSKGGRHWESLVGYTVQELKSHIESLFQPGMTWDNKGEWHLDHIVPKSFFKYTSTDDVEFKYCWSLNNLQPLWKKDNLSKGNRLIRRDM